jgi:hypothetical protein
MPVFDRERWQILEPLLDRALELSPGERTPWLDALRERAPSLAAEIAALLAAEERADRRGFLSGPAVGAIEEREFIAHAVRQLRANAGRARPDGG